MSGDELSALREMLQNTVKFHSSLEIVDIGCSWRPGKEDRDKKELPKRLREPLAWDKRRRRRGTFRLQQWKMVLDGKGLADSSGSGRPRLGKSPKRYAQ